ncbi:hypothetical protein [Fusibacter sp. 3D3]|uniref:hypothetical protein n=1 Tax=Fusibacter sp. 3D3 TaxID=1048380 RepID=UPI001586577E|nr:hypothetical protein [Fusibacter sp. 3D3]
MLNIEIFLDAYYNYYTLNRQSVKSQFRMNPNTEPYILYPASYTLFWIAYYP